MEPRPAIHEENSVGALTALLEISRRLGESADLQAVLGVVIDALRDILQADRATVFTYDAGADQLVIHVAHGVGGSSPSKTIRIGASEGIAGACASGRMVINIPDAYADDRFNRAIDQRTGYRTKSVLAIPLIDHEGLLVGVAQVLNSSKGSFDEADERIAAGLAAHAAVALRRAQLIQDRIEKENLQHELSVAKEIQQSSFPRSLPSHPSFDIFCQSTPAEECGGDAFDAFPLQGGTIAGEGEPAEGAFFLLADATGHGVGPALSSMQTRGMVRLAARLGGAIGEVSHQINAQLSDDLPPGRFVTAWLGVLDFSSARINCFSAGQGPVYIYRQARDEFEEVESDAPPFGILVPGFDYSTTRELQLDAGDMLVLITDGYYEAKDPLGAQWGEQGVFDVVRRMRSSTAAEIVAELDRCVLEFAQAKNTDDDRTSIIVKRIG